MHDPYQDTINSIYNTNAESFKKTSENLVYRNDFLEKFQEQLSGKKVLDVGCGFGRDVERLRNNGFQAYGIDTSEQLISIANPEVQKYLKLWDALTLNTYFEQKNFDWVLALASIVHMEKEYGLVVLGNIYQLLKKEGILFISLKLREEGAPEIVNRESPSTPWVTKKYLYYTLEEITGILKTLGFSIIETEVSKSDIDIVDSWIHILAKK